MTPSPPTFSVSMPRQSTIPPPPLVDGSTQFRVTRTAFLRPHRPPPPHAANTVMTLPRATLGGGGAEEGAQDAIVARRAGVSFFPAPIERRVIRDLQ